MSDQHGEPVVVERVLVAGVGNLFLGDDGFGAEVVRRLAADGDLPDGVRLVDYGIRGVHLAYDLLDGYDALVLVDALPGEGRPGDVVVLEATAAGDSGSGGLDAHGMDPVTVLSHVKAMGGTVPRTYVVGCRPENVAEGIGLSGPVAAAVPVAMAAVRGLADEVLGHRPERAAAETGRR